VKLVPHFPILHFPALEIWSLIFQSCRSVFDLFGPSFVLHFPVLHFQLTRINSLHRVNNKLSELDRITVNGDYNTLISSAELADIIAKTLLAIIH